MSNMTLDGGVKQNEDGLWCVECLFDGLTTQEEALAVSGWLEQLIEAHLHEIADRVQQ